MLIGTKPYLVIGGLLTAAAVAVAVNPETFTVTVDDVTMIVSSPPDQAAAAPFDSDADVVFVGVTWEAMSTHPDGATLTLAVDEAFTNATFKRDCELDLSLNAAAPTPGSNWSVTVANDVTDYANGDEDAEVVAASDNPGRVFVDLVVTFKTVEYDLLSAGDYVTQVTGTIAAN